MKIRARCWFCRRSRQVYSSASVGRPAICAECARTAAAELTEPQVLQTEAEIRAALEDDFAAPAAGGTVEERIRRAYFAVTGGDPGAFARLAELRPKLPGLSKADVDAALISMQRRGRAVLYPIDDPQRITKADDAAALRVSGERRDLVHLFK